MKFTWQFRINGKQPHNDSWLGIVTDWKIISLVLASGVIVSKMRHRTNNNNNKQERQNRDSRLTPNGKRYVSRAHRKFRNSTYLYKCNANNEWISLFNHHTPSHPAHLFVICSAVVIRVYVCVCLPNVILLLLQNAHSINSPASVIIWIWSFLEHEKIGPAQELLLHIPNNRNWIWYFMLLLCLLLLCFVRFL